MKLVVDGIEYIASARDVGNFAAGYIVGKYFIPWNWARAKFDKYETENQNENGNIGKHIEGLPSRLSQWKGYNVAFWEKLYKYQQSKRDNMYGAKFIW